MKILHTTFCDEIAGDAVIYLENDEDDYVDGDEGHHVGSGAVMAVVQ